MSLIELGQQLLESAQRGETENIKQLMCTGAPFTTDWFGTTPLHLAAQNGHDSTAEVLVRAGITVDTKTKLGRTPLHLAAQWGHLAVVKLLVSHGANVNLRDMLNMTPLHWAVESGNIDVVNYLLNVGAWLSIKNKFDKSPIDLANFNERSDIAAILKNAEQNQANHLQQNGGEELVISSDERGFNTILNPNYHYGIRPSYPYSLLMNHNNPSANNTNKRNGYFYPSHHQQLLHQHQYGLSNCFRPMNSNVLHGKNNKFSLLTNSTVGNNGITTPRLLVQNNTASHLSNNVLAVSYNSNSTYRFISPSNLVATRSSKNQTTLFGLKGILPNTNKIMVYPSNFSGNNNKIVNTTLMSTTNQALLSSNISTTSTVKTEFVNETFMVDSSLNDESTVAHSNNPFIKQEFIGGGGIDEKLKVSIEDQDMLDDITIQTNISEAQLFLQSLEQELNSNNNNTNSTMTPPSNSPLKALPMPHNQQPHVINFTTAMDQCIITTSSPLLTRNVFNSQPAPLSNKRLKSTHHQTVTVNSAHNITGGLNCQQNNNQINATTKSGPQQYYVIVNKKAAVQSNPITLSSVTTNHPNIISHVIRPINPKRESVVPKTTSYILTNEGKVITNQRPNHSLTTSNVQNNIIDATIID